MSLYLHNCISEFLFVYLYLNNNAHDILGVQGGRGEMRPDKLSQCMNIICYSWDNTTIFRKRFRIIIRQLLSVRVRQKQFHQPSVLQDGLPPKFRIVKNSPNGWKVSKLSFLSNHVKIVQILSKYLKMSLFMSPHQNLISQGSQLSRN